MKLRDEDCGAIVGVRGSGKSHYAKHRIVKNAERCAVWDPNAEYAEACDLDEVTVAELNEEPELLLSAECRLAVVPEWDDDADLAEQFAIFKRSLKASAPQPRATLVVIDECGLLRPKADGTLVALAAQSRHWRMPLVMVAQRMMMLPPGARAQTSLIVSFRQTETEDIQALAARPGFGAARAGRVATLPRRRFVVWSESEAFDNKRAESARVSGVH